MRLFLSSEDFGKYPEALVELAGDNTKVAFVNNAKDNWSAEDRIEKTEEKKQGFHQLGFEVHELDLRGFFGQPKQLEEELKSFGMIWASGGNTFILRRAMKTSGLDKILQKRLGEDSLVYGGSSAGSIIATPSLHGTELGDDPNEIPQHYPREIVWQGLNLVDFYIVPHFKSDWFGKEADAMVAYLEKRKLPYKTLKDGQVIIIDGTKKELLK